MSAGTTLAAETTTTPSDGNTEAARSVLARRWPVYLLVLAAFCVPFAIALGVLAEPTWYPTLDLALTELRVRDVFGGNPPLLGLPGRIGTLSEQGSHPGPLSFWALAPGYELFGGSAWALHGSNVILNVAAIALTLWMVLRRGTTALMLGVAVGLAVLLGLYGPDLLTQPWNPYLPVLWWMVFLVAVWSVLDDDLAMLPVAVLAGSYCAQTHISYIGLVVGLGALAVVGAAWSVYSRRDDPAVRRAAWCWGVVSVGLVAVLWAAPIYQQITGSLPNFTIIYNTFSDPPEAPAGIRTGGRLLLVHMNPWRWVAGSDSMTGSVIPGMALLIVWAASAIVAWRIRVRSLVRLDIVLAAAAVLGTISLSRIHGVLFFYLALWTWSITTLMIISIGWSAVAWWMRRAQPSQRARLMRFGPATLGGLLGIALGSFAFAATGAGVPDQRISETISEVAPLTLEALEQDDVVGGGRDGQYVVTWFDPVTIGSAGFALVDELDRKGFDVGLAAPFRARAPGGRLYEPGEFTGVVHLAVGEMDIERWRAKPGVLEIAFVDSRTEAEQDEYERLRREVVADLERAGFDEAARNVGDNLFIARFGGPVPPRTHEPLERMLELGKPTAVFIGPPESYCSGTPEAVAECERLVRAEV